MPQLSDSESMPTPLFEEQKLLDLTRSYRTKICSTDSAERSEASVFVSEVVDVLSMTLLSFAQTIAPDDLIEQEDLMQSGSVFILEWLQALAAETEISSLDLGALWEAMNEAAPTLNALDSMPFEVPRQLDLQSRRDLELVIENALSSFSLLQQFVIRLLYGLSISPDEIEFDSFLSVFRKRLARIQLDIQETHEKMKRDKSELKLGLRDFLESQRGIESFRARRLAFLESLREPLLAALSSGRRFDVKAIADLFGKTSTEIRQINGLFRERILENHGPLLETFL